MSDASEPKTPGDFVPLSDEREDEAGAGQSSSNDENNDPLHGETNIPPAPP
ncbi:MAG: hypothetical protein KIT89_01105 [Microcella sp.]|uniref:hypothetical protein n=1 Tax=Microcella sp. TaxID=1913979 RepID=UPI0024C8C066|nr:hypothetical protein [Microcella sp.]UYN83867.1 MAG: hypothetical protein KIT89_01105 [Microcella sp.]